MTRKDWAKITVDLVTVSSTAKISWITRMLYLVLMGIRSNQASTHVLSADATINLY